MCICIRINRYNAQWYDASLYMQKLMLFILQRSNKRTALTTGIFDASLEGFATVIITNFFLIK